VARYLWEHRGWTRRLRWDEAEVLLPLGAARRRQGEILGEASQLGFDLGMEARAAVLTDEAITTAAIEGERLDPAAVRSSVARRLGLQVAGLPPAERHVDGLVQMLLDATQRHARPLTARRLRGWQAALFPTGYSGIRPIRTGRWRTGSAPMQVVSGPLGRERVHYEAPPSSRVGLEMQRFLRWWSTGAPREGLLRAGLAHFWFVTIHPFEDGNGRIARAIADMALAQDEGASLRLYSMSVQIRAEQKAYYAVLERAQRGDGDVTEWLVWFLRCLEGAVERSRTQVRRVLARQGFWLRHAGTSLTERQRKVVQRLVEAGPGGFEGGITTRKYVGMTKTSRATAQREIADLLERGILAPRPGGGRSTSYDLAW
jgi:Fic family protein